jgi:hypothetical protein
MEETRINAADTVVEKSDSVNRYRTARIPCAIVVGAETVTAGTAFDIQNSG